ESSGLIVPMGAWVLETALAQLAQWRARGLTLTMSVNVSPGQLREGFAAALIQRLAELELETGWLTIEVTETALIHEAGRSIRELAHLRAAGVEIALDDFGTGYSSLTWLTQFPVSIVKIDRSFTAEILDDPRTSVIVEAVIDVAHKLDVTVIAEGVEHDDQHRWLAEHGCDEAQGYLFGAPMGAGVLPWT
ncbi:MAG: EAL domain-containing protein, partial [Actinomycetota bacterium]|nr:EAL domain-containing protein [Actinomycetota bacterium]